MNKEVKKDIDLIKDLKSQVDALADKYYTEDKDEKDTTNIVLELEKAYSSLRRSLVYLNKLL